MKKYFIIYIGKRINRNIMGISIVSENYFKNDNSDYAKSLRAMYGEDGYEKYTAKMNSIMTAQKEVTNPIAKSKAEYIKTKEAEYKNALAMKAKAANIWGRYKNSYSANLSIAKQNNNGYSLSGAQKQQALSNSGDGAVAAYRNFTKAQSEADFALSLYNDATHSGITWLS